MITANYFNIILLVFFPLITLSQTTDNVELKKIHDDDQNSRMVEFEEIDWKKLIPQDSMRRVRVLELLDSNQVITGKDYYRSAMIFQHGKDSTDYRMAIKLMKKAIELDTTIDRWLLAAAIDRELKSRKEPQIYGTQYFKDDGEDSKWQVYKIDTTKITDEERKFYGVEPIAEFIENIRLMNLLSITKYYSKTNSIDTVVNLIILEKKKKNKSEYNVSESEINAFGYELLHANKINDALIIFKLNTELYSNAFNTFDSLGECLLLLNRKEDGLKAYKKSLELNPNNKNALRIIKEQE